MRIWFLVNFTDYSQDLVPWNHQQRVAYHVVELGHLGVYRKFLAPLQYRLIVIGVWLLNKGVYSSILQAGTGGPRMISDEDVDQNQRPTG